MTVQAAILNLQAKALALSGMKSAPDAPPDAAGAFPFAASYERIGKMVTHSYGFSHELVTIFTELHVTRQNLTVAIDTAMPFRDPFLVAIRNDPTLGGTISTIEEVRWTFGALKWGTVDTIGYRFEIDVKVAI